MIVGGIIFTILFSVINLATNGYYLKTIYATDPNTTIAQKEWFTDVPWSWGDKLKPTCLAQNIPIGYQFFTTNSGLSYTLESVSQYNATSNETVRFPSLQYLNQNLQGCHIDNVVLYMKKADQSKNGYSAWWSWDDSSAAATARCMIYTEGGPVNVTFSTTYKTSPKQFDYTISNNYNSNTSSSMWWGTRLLNLYWSSTLVEMASALYPTNDTVWSSTPIWTKGQMTFTPNITTDIKAYEFFGLRYFFLAGDASLINDLIDLNLMYNNRDNTAFSGPLTEGLTWAKIMYSMILTDLGEIRAPNLLLDSSLLQWALQYPGDIFREDLNNMACSRDDCDYDWINYMGIAAPGLDPSDRDHQTPMNQSYNAFKDLMGQLGTKKATIYLQYACSVPERKDTGTLFLAVLIADLVFLQVMWAVLNFIAGLVVTRQDNMAMACHAHANQDYGLVGLGMSPGQGMNSKLGLGGSSATSREVLVVEEGYGRNGYMPVR